MNRPRASNIGVIAAASLVSLFVLGCASAAGVGAGRPSPPSSGADDALRWAPPSLSRPTTIDLGQGYSAVHMDPARDYVIRLPASGRVGGVTLEGGHDVVLIGGHISIPSTAASGPEASRRAVYIKGATGTVHIEGLLLDAAPGVMWDGVDIAAPEATVQLENVRIEGITGDLHAFHGDAVQPWGGVKDLHIDRLSASSDYQGLTIPIDRGPIARAELSHVDLDGVGGEGQGGGHLLWLTSGTASCQTFDVSLTQVFVQPRRARRLGNSVWPQAGLRKACGARVRRHAASWPGLPTVQGHVTAGAPTGGAFVPRPLVDSSYTSPGYSPQPSSLGDLR